MLNQVVLVGRLTREITINKTDTGKEIATIPLAIPRSFKNMDGIYDTDFIDCTVWDNTAKNTKEYCHKGDVIGIKGRLVTNINKEEDKGINKLQVIAEKVTFLTSKTSNS